MAGYRFIREGCGFAFLFPGQGSQEVGMASELIAAYPVVRDTFAEADELLGFALSDLIADGPEEELTDTINAQPALLATSVAILRVIESEVGSAPLAGINNSDPVYVAGHSMGEYSALVAAGSLSFADGLRLVRERGRLMQEAGTAMPGKMAAVLGLDEATVATVCREAVAGGGYAQVANDNCPGQVVISGDHQGVDAAIAGLEKAGAKKIVPLAISIASHSPLMDSAANALRDVIAATPIVEPEVPVIANTSGELLTSVEQIRDELAAQLTGSVRWTTSMQRAVDDGIANFVEIGPGDVLIALVKRVSRKTKRQAINDPESVRAFVTRLTGE